MATTKTKKPSGGDRLRNDDHEPFVSAAPISEGGTGHLLSVARHLPARAAIISGIRGLQAQRVAVIRMQIRIDNQSRALARRFLGWQWDLPEKDRARICRLAAESVEAIYAGKPVPAAANGLCDVLGDTIQVSGAARDLFTGRRAEIEKAMTKMARELPVWPWVEAIRGFGELGLAMIVGEAGDLAGYANPAKLWKRLGLAPGDCYRDMTLAGEPCFKKPKRRRSVMWNIGQSLIKGNDGAYREVYLARKFRECEKAVEEGLVVVTTTKATVAAWAEKGFPAPTRVKKIDKATMRTCGHIDLRAQRYVEKRLLRHLWRAWNRG